LAKAERQLKGIGGYYFQAPSFIAAPFKEQRLAVKQN